MCERERERERKRKKRRRRKKVSISGFNNTAGEPPRLLVSSRILNSLFFKAFFLALFPLGPCYSRVAVLEAIAYPWQHDLRREAE